MSRSATVRDRLASRSTFRKIAGIAFTILYGTYLIWRLSTFSPNNPTFSTLFFLAEFLAYLVSIVSIYCSWTYRHREPTPPKSGQSVDVFIPVYKEPTELIRMTIMAAQRIDYPHRVLMLDDGKRDELKELAESLGVVYVRREGSQGAKAGNMNHGLQFSEADFIMVFDADHIAQPEAIDAVLCFMEDDEVNLVQTPQEYYNTDSIQFLGSKRGRKWHDQSRFFSVTESCKDNTNSSSCLGTGVLYRRSGVDKIGGFPEETVTEDMHTSLKMHKAGMKTVYLNEPIAYGVASADLVDYYKTRHRWAHGNMHAFHEEKPIRSKGLTLKQKFFYSELVVIYLEGWQQLIMFAVPILALCFGWQPFEITPVNVAVILSFPLLMAALQDEQSCGLGRAWANQLFTIARMPIQLISWSGFFGKKISWNPSTKNIEGHFNWQLVVPQLFLLVASLIALAIGGYKLYADMSWGPLTAFFYTLIFGAESSSALLIRYEQGFSLDLFIVSSFWVVYNITRVFFWVIDSYRRAKKTNDHFRFEVPLLFQADDGRKVRADWVSQTELGIDDAFLMELAEETISGVLWLPSGPHKLGLRLSAKKNAAAFVYPDRETEDAVWMSIYSVDWHEETNEREAYFPTFLEKIRGWFWRPYRPNLREWDPGLMQTDEGPKYCLVSNRDDEIQLLGFGKSPASSSIEVIDMQETSHVYQLGEKLPLQGWCRKCIDGVVRWKYRIIR